MVVKMMKWRPWPSQSPPATRKYEVRLAIRRISGGDLGKTTVEIRWKGPKLALSSLRRPAVKRNFTREVDASSSSSESPNSVVVWDDEEEFHSVCSFSAVKDNAFHPWEIAFTVFNGLNQGSKNKIPIVGTALLNLSEHISEAEEKEIQLNIPITPYGVAIEPCPTLTISLGFVELRTSQENAELVERSIVPVSSESEEKDEVSALKAGLRKVKILTGYVSSKKKAKKTRLEDGGGGSAKSDGDYNYPFDSDSLDDFEEGESDEGKIVIGRKSLSYGSLAHANYAGGSFFSSSSAKMNGEDEDWVYYSHRRSDAGCSRPEESGPSISEPSSMRGLLSWRKRKLNFKPPKVKGEPLLKKDYGEEGGDDIDFDRRQLSSDESLSLGRGKTEEDSSANRSSVSDFGEDNFAIGSWENKEFTSRDGNMNLQTQVFFASIDQRSERAAGESACTALVAVIADWFQNNRDLLPIKSQFDSLIRDGSLEWRNLCRNESYRERFPDKHFDLETVLQAEIRPLSVAPEKSFIGFFHPEEAMDDDEKGSFDFLRGAMSFENIWDDIGTGVYIVSWNDHFFVLKVEAEAYYIVDTLGERLFEGCDQAYILKFDSSTEIRRNSHPPDEMEAEKKKNDDDDDNDESKVCRGKECCKEYMKSFLAAIPLRELQADVKKGLTSSPIHQRLQIEFTFTQPSSRSPDEIIPAIVSEVMMTESAS